MLNNSQNIVPFFGTKTVVIYRLNSKFGKTMAKKFKFYAYEKLNDIGIECLVEIYSDVEAKTKMASFEKKNYNIVFIGKSSLSKSLTENIEKWDFDRFGMKYSSKGNESIICVNKLKPKSYSDFFICIQNQSSEYGERLKKVVTELNKTFISDYIEKDDLLLVKMFSIFIGFPLLCISKANDIFIKSEAKNELKKLQYNIAIEKFILSKIQMQTANEVIEKKRSEIIDYINNFKKTRSAPTP